MLHLFIPDIPVLEKIVRSIVIYVFLLIAFRFSGKRQVGQLTPFDLVVLLILSNVVQNALIGNDNSLGGGMIGAAAILIVNAIVIEVTFRYKKARRLLESQPALLVHNGRVLEDAMRRERITHDDLHAALRLHGVATLAQVRLAVLEDNGAISVIAY